MQLMIVAHPDDESLFGGFQLLNGGWTVLCITNGNNPIRRKEFENVMDITKSPFLMWNYPDVFKTPFNLKNLTNDLKNILNKKWDKILTHGPFGENNNLHHKQIHSIMRDLTDNLSFFDLTGPELMGEIWDSKLNLINQHKSQKRVCEKYLYLAKREKYENQG